jgi:hypothetical protein
VELNASGLSLTKIGKLVGANDLAPSHRALSGAYEPSPGAKGHTGDPYGPGCHVRVSVGVESEDSSPHMPRSQLPRSESQKKVAVVPRLAFTNVNSEALAAESAPLATSQVCNTAPLSSRFRYLLRPPAPTSKPLCDHETVAATKEPAPLV